VAALKHINQDALTLYYELSELRTKFRNTSNKDDKRFDKNLDVLIREKEERMFRLIKFNDYPAMIMAAYPDAKLIDSYNYKRNRDTITDPILIRGISSGGHAKHAIANNRDFYFIETGYLGNYRCDNNQTGRKIYHRIEKNSMQQSRIMDVPDDRWRELCSFNPALNYNGWKKPGSKILLIMSTEKPFEYYGTTKDEWVNSTIAALRQHSDREIVIREKAGRGERTNDTIYDALDKDIHAVVTYNSIAAVEAIQYGIPAFCTAPTAASAVSTGDFSQIENPHKPSEDVIYKWLSSVAYGQFSLNEILTGQAWNLVQENEQRPTFSY
jgi:hypothetical protein